MLELISPAGSPEAVVAAVQSGADAVFFGQGKLSGHRGDGGFTGEEFENAVRYCRVRGCRVYAAMNILVSDGEIPQCVSTAQEWARLGVDAIVVSDLGLVHVLHEALPDMPLFGDVSMGVHNLAGARAVGEAGLSRIMLPRELPLDEIRQICAGAGLETSVFVQSGLCVCEPGLCYLSAMGSGRSANRGICTGTCRREFSLGGRKDDRPLSMKDWNLMDSLTELESAGVTGAVIEGRGQRAEFVAMAVKMFRTAIHDGKKPSEQEQELFAAAFSSQGFTDGYYTGETDDMFGYHVPSTDRDVSRGLAEVRNGYSSGEMRRVPVDFFALIEAEERSKFVACDGDGNKAAALGPVPAASELSPLTAQAIEEVMYKTGGTPYICSSVSARISPHLSMSEDELGAVRHELLAKLTEERRRPREVRTGTVPPLPAAQERARRPMMILQVLSTEQLSPELAAMKPDFIYLPLEELAENFDRLELFIRYGCVPCALMPPVIHGGEEEDRAFELLQTVRSYGVKQALICSLGHVTLVRRAGMQARGDYGLNVFNSYTADMLRRAGLLSYTASFELHMGQLRAMSQPMDMELIVYGRLPIMITEHCLIKNSAGKCACQSPGQLSDGHGNVYPVVRGFNCRNTIFGAHKLFLADRRAEYEKLGLWGTRLIFTTESSRECVEVARSYLGVSDYRPNGLTRGRMYKGVE